MAYGDFKDLTRRTASDKMLFDNAFNIAENVKYDGYHNIIIDLFQWSTKFSIKKNSGSVIKNENISNKELAEELQKPIFRRRGVGGHKSTLIFHRQYLRC